VLLTEMPVRPNAPEPKRAIAFDRAIRIRMEELGIDEAGLTNRYATLLKVHPDRRRNVVLRILRGEADPRLKTVFNLLDSRVLDGELLVRWTDSNSLRLISDSETLARALQERMREVGLNPNQPSAIYELTRRYCSLKSGNKPRNPVNYIKVVKQLISEPNSQVQTIATVVQALTGELLIRWKKTVRQQLQAPKAAYDFLENLPPEQTLVLEYQALGEEQGIRSVSKVESSD